MGASLAGKLITILPRSVFDKDSKRFLEVDDFPIQDMMSHDQHRDSLWQNKNEMPEVQDKVITLQCLLEKLLAGSAGTSTPCWLYHCWMATLNKPPLHNFSLFLAPGKRSSTFRANFPATVQVGGEGWENKQTAYRLARS